MHTFKTPDTEIPLNHGFLFFNRDRCFRADFSTGSASGAPIRDSERAGIVLRSFPFGRCTAHGKIFYGTAKS
jgi:hypothetical protein